MLEDKITDLMNRAIDAGELAGCNLKVTVRGADILSLSAGYADVKKGKKVEYDSIFRLYSQTKPITAAAVALLTERGALDPCAWASDFLPGFDNPKMYTPNGDVKPIWRRVTVKDLLSMTAGLSYPGGLYEEKEISRLFYENQEAIRNGGGLGTVELANKIGEIPLAFEPGSRFKYSTCADVLGAIVEVASGKKFGDFLKDEFFEPLGMRDTAFFVPKEKTDRLVTCYQRTENGLKEYSELHLCVGDYSKSPAFESGGAGLVSTLDDYGKFAEMLLSGGTYRGRKILSRETVKWLTSPQLSRELIETMWDHLSGYSYGKLMRVCVEPGRVGGLAKKGEYGWDGWLGCYFANFPREKMTILFNENTKDAGTTTLIRKIRNVILSELF